VRGLLLALSYNFVWAPLIGFVLARVFLHDPLLALGFLLVMVVPCSSMSIAYPGLAKGDVELSTVIVGSSFVVAVVAFPAWMMIFAAGYDVPRSAAQAGGSPFDAQVKSRTRCCTCRILLLYGQQERLSPILLRASHLRKHWSG